MDQQPSELDGTTAVTHVLREGSGLPIRVALAIVHEVAAALDEAHKRGVTHGALSAATVHWTESGEVLLSGLGAEDGNGPGASSADVALPPERRSGQPPTPASDLWSLGALLYHCLTGQPWRPDRGPTNPLEDFIIPPEGLDELLGRLVAPRPEERPTDAGRVAREIRTLLDDLEVFDLSEVLRDADSEDNDAEPGWDEGGNQTEPGGYLPETEHDPRAIRVQRRSAFLANAATRGPAIIGMLTVAVGLGGGVYIFRKQEEYAKERRERIADGPTVSTSAAEPPRTGDGRDVFVQLRFQGRKSVWVDGREIGSWDGHVRLALPPGRYRLAVRGEGTSEERVVTLEADTHPTFEFYGAH